MGLFDKKILVEGLNSFGKQRLPPGQQPTEKFPVLTYGDVPAINITDWRLKAWGSLEQEVKWTWEEFSRLPFSTITADFHCVTHWSRFDDRWGGVLFKDLLPLLKLNEGVRFVMQHSYGGYTTNLPLQVMIEEDVMLATMLNDSPLPPEHGGPLRIITPRRYAWKGAKWLQSLEFMSDDRPGFWEMNGYSNTADPWKNDRYW